jgi:phosphatidylglycerophosphate synthase
MKNLPRISEIRHSQDLSKTRIPVLTRYVFIPLALPLTVVALALGMTPNKVTYSRFVLCLAALGLMAQPDVAPFYMGIALFLLFVVMDSIDGNIARFRDQASYYGKFLDGFVDNIGDFLFPLALSMHVYRTDGSVGAIFSAAVATIALATTFTVLNRNTMIELAFELREGRPADQITKVPAALSALMGGPVGRLCQIVDIHGMNVAFDLRYVFLFGAMLIGAYNEFLTFLAAVNLMAAAFYTSWRLVRAFCFLNVHRRSRSARIP